MRSAAGLLLLAGLCACLLGCPGADTGPSGVLVRLATLDADGPIAGRLHLRLAEGPEAGTMYELRGAGGADADVYVAPGAPEGSYHVVSEAGWGMLWMQPVPPVLTARADVPPRVVPMGRPHTVYVASEDARRWEAGETWGLDRRAPGGREWEPVVPEAVLKQGGWIVIRVPAHQWQPRVEMRLLGRMTDGAWSALSAFEIREPDGPRPRLVTVHPSPTVPLGVRLDGSPLPPDGRRERDVHVLQEGLPLPVAIEGRTHRGVVWIEGLPALDAPVRIGLDGVPSAAETAARLSVEDLRRLVECVLLDVAPSDPEARRVIVRGNLDPGAQVLVRTAGSERYALALSRPVEGGLEVVTHGGAQSWWVVSGRRWYALRFPEGEPVAGTDRVVILGGEPLAGCRVMGRVVGGLPGYRVVFLRKEEGGRAEGHGFNVGVDLGAQYQALLPPGDYQVGVVRPDGRAAGPWPMTLKAGGEVRRDFELR